MRAFSVYWLVYLTVLIHIPFFFQPIPIIRVTLPKLQFFFIPVFLVMSIIYGNKFFIVILQFFVVVVSDAVVIFIRNIPNETHRVPLRYTFSQCLVRVKHNYATST